MRMLQPSGAIQCFRKEMASLMALQFCSTNHSQSFFVCRSRLSSSEPSSVDLKLQFICNRRKALTALTAMTFLAKEALTGRAAYSFDLRITVPDQTPEEAYAGVRTHAAELLEIRDLLDSQLWREAQEALRKSSAYLKQDLYTIIQAKPRSERTQLRQLYSNLFYNVSRLDYAARDGDATRVEKCYANIVAATEEIFARIL